MTRLARTTLAAALAVAALLVTVTTGPAGAVASSSGVFVYTPGAGGDGLWSQPTGTVAHSVSGTYVPVVGNFVGDFTEDIFWYGRGTAPDALWEIGSDGTKTIHAVSVNGTYTPVAGFFSETPDGSSDLYDDILWYAPGTASEALWDFNSGGTITKTSGAWINGTYRPVVGRFAANESAAPSDGSDDILWLRAGGQSTLWDFNRNGSISKTPWDLGAAATPIVVNTGSVNDRLFLYRPGTQADVLVDLLADTYDTYAINGTYIPVVGRFSSSGFASTSILWYAPGTAADPQWTWNGSRFAAGPTRRIDGTYTPIVGGFTQAGFDQILWFPRGGGRSTVWAFGAGTGYTSTSVTLPTGSIPVPLYGFS